MAALWQYPVVASRYRSSDADKAAAGVAPELSRSRVFPDSSHSNHPTEAEERRRDQWKTAGCQRGHSTGRYLYVCDAGYLHWGAFFPMPWGRLIYSWWSFYDLAARWDGTDGSLQLSAPGGVTLFVSTLLLLEITPLNGALYEKERVFLKITDFVVFSSWT